MPTRITALNYSVAEVGEAGLCWMFSSKSDWFTYKIILESKNDAVWELITFSNILDKSGKREIGRWFLGSVFDPFLNNAFNFAILQGSGNVEWEIERFIIWEIGFANTSAPSLIKIPDSLSISLFALVYFKIP